MSKENEKKVEDTLVMTTKRVEDIRQRENMGLPLKRHEKLWFKGIKDIRKASIPFAMTNNELQEYAKCKLSVHYFAQNYCNIKREDGTIGPLTLRDYQKEIIDLYTNNRFSILMASRQTGKAQDLDSIVWDENGPKLFGSLKIGDKIYDDKGNLTNVIGIYPQGEKDIYEVEFSDGLSVRCCKEHLWELQKYTGKKSKTEILQLSDIMDNYLTNRGDSIYYVKMNDAVKYPKKELDIDPYLLGLIIGNGSTRNNRLKITTKDKEISDYLYTLIDDDIDVILENRKDRMSYDYKIIKKHQKFPHKIINNLRKLDLMEKLSYDKFIPKDYLYSDIEQRISLLQGLMDTDGFISKNQPSYSTSSKQLSEDVRELCHSLGIRTKIREKITTYTYKGVKKIGKKSYIIRLFLKNNYQYPIFRLNRKQSQIKNKHFDWGQKRGIINIKYHGKKEAQCIEVDNDNHLYLTDNYIPTHNTVSASITMLHYCLFNNDKGIMIVANKSKTVQEIVRKIKDIYKYLPFWMKKGVLNWNESSLTFENGCRIQSENRTKEPSIGFTVDFLYLDEFAKVPSNIIEPYYGAVVPTVSSVENSKIIITSTPDGFNMFHKLLIDAERDEDDPLKNPYKAMRVYWHQVKGRKDTRIFPLKYKMKEYGITDEDIKEELLNMKYKLYEKNFNGKDYIMVNYDDDIEETGIQFIRTLRIKKIPLQEICIITNWKEEETKLIGSENMFNQEYNIQFVTGDKLLFDSDQMNRFKQNTNEFEYLEFDKISDKIFLPYNKLKWIKNKPELFNVSQMKDYHICASVDLGEGLGQDYTVLNIFRLVPKDKDKIEKTHERLKNVYEYFKLEQIGIFRANNWSIQEFAELFYLVMFELFDPEKVKVVLEFNKYGGELLTALPYVFGEENQFSNGIFLRYKHKKDDQMYKVGLKISSGEQDASKKILIKSFQNAVKKSLIELHNDININEISMFIKKETSSGNFTYKAESGNDDTVMTLINLSSVFEHTHYKSLVENLLSTLTGEIKDIINKYAFDINKPTDNVGLAPFGQNFKKVYGNGKQGGFKPWKSSPWSN